jgi:hypothetical protein
MKEPPHGLLGTEKRRKWMEMKEKLAEQRRVESGRELISCLECGKQMFSLGNHLTAKHGITWREYAAKHGLPLGARASTREVSENAKQRAHDLSICSGLLSWKKTPEGLKNVEMARNGELILGRNNSGRPASDKQVENGRELFKRFGAVNHAALRKRSLDSGTRVNRVCQFCGATYSAQTNRNRYYCSRECFHADERRKADERLQTR